MIKVEFTKEYKGVTSIVCDHLQTHELLLPRSEIKQVIAELYIHKSKKPFEIPANLIKHISSFNPLPV
jgi:hypothetical protein